MSGKIIRVTSDVIDISFAPAEMPEIGNILKVQETHNLMQVEQILDKTTVRAVLILISTKNVYVNQKVINTKRNLSVPIGSDTNGLVFNIAGEVLNKEEIPLFKNIPLVLEQSAENDFTIKYEIIETGIKIIDFFLPILKGSKIGIFGGAGVGKTVIIKELIFNITKQLRNLKTYYVGTGERSREGKELYDELVESQLIDNVTMFISQMNEPSGARQKIVPLALTAAEYSRDTEKRDVLFFIDNIYRYVQAGAELAFSLGRKPSEAGYQASLASEISSVQERLRSSQKASITSFQTIFLPMDDINDPAAVTIFSHLDSSLVLSRSIAGEGYFPAIDPLASSTSNAQQKIIGKRHFDLILKTKSILRKFKELEDMILILGMDELDPENQLIVKKAVQLKAYFTQNFHMAEAFTKRQGVFVSKEKNLLTIEKIINGEFLDLYEEEFFFISDYRELEAKQRALLTLEVQKQKTLETELKKLETQKKRQGFWKRALNTAEINSFDPFSEDSLTPTNKWLNDKSWVKPETKERTSLSSKKDKKENKALSKNWKKIFKKESNNDEASQS